MFADRALGLGLEHPRILHIRAAARERSGDLRGVLADLEEAHRLDSDNPGIANALGVALTLAGRAREAAALLEQATVVAPELAATWFNLGGARMACGWMAEAEGAYRRSVELDPANAAALAKLAVLAIHRGNPDAALDHAARALTLDPTEPEARRALIEAAIEQKRPSDAEREARAWSSTPGLGPNARIHALGLLGDALDAQGRYGEAFAAYAGSKAAFAAANQPTFATLDTNPLSDTLGQVQREFDATPSEAWRAPDAPEEGPSAKGHIFLMGFMRSGTTLLEQAVARHPDVVTIEELETLARSGGALIGQPGGLAQISQFNTADIEAARAAYWRAVADAGIAAEGKVVIDKLPFNGIKLPLIAKLFPDAKVIFAIRDPRDVVLSCFQKRLPPNGFSYEMRTVEGAARFYAAYMELVQAYRARLAIPILDHRHELLIADVRGSIEEACRFIGIDFWPEMVNFQDAARSGRVMSQSSRQLGEGLTARGAGHWRHYAAELAPVLPVLQPWVSSYGYSQD